MKRLMVGFLCVFAATISFSAEVSINLLPKTLQKSRTGLLKTASLPPADGVVRQHRLSAGAAKVQTLAVGDVLVLSLFEDCELQIELVSEKRAHRGRAFLGRARDGLGMIDCVVLETENGLVVDVTDSKNGRVWKVVSDESGVCVEEVKPTQGVKCPSRPLLPPRSGTPIPVLEVNTEGSEATVVTNRFVIPPPAMSSVVSTPEPVVGSGIPSLLLPAVAERPTVDIMVAYDSDAANWANSNGGGIQAFAETAVQKMNTAIANTGLDAKFSFRLVGVFEIGGSAGGSLDYAVKFASGEIAGTLNGVSWAGVAQKRDEVRADVVCVLADTGGSSGTTGLGYSLTAGTADPAGCGYNACAIRAVAQSHTMTHEVGHNMGAGHSDQMADESNRGPQYHSYSSGYYFYVDGVGYYTIMAYNADGYGNYYTEVPYFSSPDYTYRGKAVGDATHNNSKTLSLTYSTIVNNRRTPVVSADVGIGLDAEDYEWTTDGSYPWARTTDRSADHVDSASSCLTPANPGITSWAETQVVGPATLSFSYFFVSYGGQFLVTCDGTQLFSYGSSSQAIQMVNWSTASNLSIPSGTHTVRFAHINNNSSFYSPANAVWVDKVVFAGGTPPNTEYTISFNANGGSSAPSAITRKDGAEYGELPTLTRTGYTFDGWYTAASGGTKVTATTKATGNVTLYAHWTAVKYAITYNLDGGSNASSNPATYTVEDAVTLAAPTRSGYTFSGWTPNDGKIAKGSTGAKTFTATWMKNVVVKYTISFNANGGSSAPAAITREEGAEYGELPTVTRTGYTFDGWYTAASGGTKVTATTKATEDVTLYAHWSATVVAGLVHRWSFNGDLTDSVGGQTATKVGSVTSTGSQYALTGGRHGVSYISLGSNVLPIDTGAVTIEIWATKNAAKSWARVFDIGSDKLHDLMWAWEDGGDGSDAFNYNDHNCYSTGVACASGTEYYFVIRIVNQQNGNARVTCTRYNASSGVFVGEQSMVMDKYDLSSMAQGYCWLGHSHVSNDSDASASYNEVRVWSRALTDAELAAGVKAGPDALPSKSSFVVKFDANGGSPVPSAITRDEGSEYGTLPTVARAGYTFDGWYTAASGGTKVTATTKATGDVTLYAHWVSSPSGSGNVSVTSVTAQQRYPVDGLVDITVTLQGTVADVTEAECLFAATNGATKAAIPVVHITRNGDDTGSNTTWTRKFIWDLKPDVGAVKIDDVALTVAIKGTTSVEGGVQLWENGPYWADCNVGATKPEEAGYYFWWGDTVGYKRNANNDGWVSVKDSTSFLFDGGNCPTYCKDNSQLQSDGYIDSTGNLASAHDAATVHLGVPWRMPTDVEFLALINNCTTTWTTRNGVNGRLVVGKGAYASKSIFLPTAGFGSESYLYGLGCDGGYWASTPTSFNSYSLDAWRLYFYSDYFDQSYVVRHVGQSVRPVRGFASTTAAIGGVTTHFVVNCREVTISFNAQGGSPTPLSTTLYEGSEYGELPTVTRTGYTFDGWHTAATGGTKVTATTKAMADVTLYAHWTAVKYAITYILDGGTNASSNPTTYTVEDAVSLVAPTRSGYTFSGWMPDDGKIAKGSTGAKTFTATWTKNVLKVTAVTMQQQYPLNGLVDIVVTIQGASNDVEEAYCLFSASNGMTRAAIPVAHITRNGNDSGSGMVWTRKFIWDAKSDVGAVKIDDVALTVDVELQPYVQLWENGPYWAKCNVGAAKPEEYGYYFWWGDTVGYKRNASNNGWISVKDSTGFSFSSGNCPTYDGNNYLLRSAGYIDAAGNLVAAHDAATAHLGAPWRMPTDAEFSALIDNCTTTWTTRNGVAGRLVTGKGAYSLKSIFLPAAGHGTGSDLYFLGSRGDYWSSTPYSYDSKGSWYPYFTSSDFLRNFYYRYDGRSVRPVRGFASTTAAIGGVTTHFSFDCTEVIISFDAQGGSPTPLAITLYEGSEYGELPTVTRTGYTFDGWYMAPTGGTKVTATTKATGSATLYAHWTETVSVMSVTAQQRYPWNGLVDIVVTIRGAAEDVAEAECSFTATNSATGVAIPVLHIVCDGEDTGANTTWTRKFIWDAKTDVGAVKIGDVALTVAAKVLGGVQLWENGPCWAECNVGASQPEEYGYYFWWGDTIGYRHNASNSGWVSVKDGSSYSFNGCPTDGKNNSQLQSDGYIDATGNLVAAHDAATAHLGAPWRMPTEAEFSALISNCTTTWTTRNGERGLLVTGKGAYSSKSIFLPPAGYGRISNLDRSGSITYYWSSTPNDDHDTLSWSLISNSEGFYMDDFRRDFGHSVRPVRGFANAGVGVGGVTTHFSLDCPDVTILFDAQGGSTTPSAITLYEGCEYGELPTVTRTGYTFDGWYTVASGGTKVTATTKATDNTTLYAHWTAVKYAITYNLNGGINASTNPMTYTIEDSVTLAAPMRSGYTFSGWTPNDGTIAKGSTGAKTFTAIWTMDEVLEVNNDGDREYSVGEDVGWDCNLFVVEASSAVTVSVTGLPDGLGYRTEVDDNEVLVYFTGRAVRAGRYQVVCNATDAAGRSVSDSIWVEIIESGDAAFDYVDNWDGTITLMRYRGESVPEQLVIPSEYDGKKVTGVGLLQLRTQEEWDKYDGISFFGENEDERIVIGSKLKSVKLPEGLVTIGINSPFAYQSGITSVEFPSTLKNIGDWAFCCCTGLKSVDLSGTALENCLWSSFAGCKAMAEVKFPSTLTTLGGLSFAWCRALKSVTFEGNAPTIQNYTSDGGRDGAKWGDWAGRIYVDSGFDFRSFDTQRSNTKYLKEVVTYVQPNTTGWGAVPGTWQGCAIALDESGLEAVTIHFDANGGAPVPSDITRGEGLEYGALPAVTRTGYTFDGWYTAVNGGTKVTATTKATGDVTLYAHWAANEYKVKFDANGGVGVMLDQTFQYDAVQKLTSNGFTRTGCEFLGWSTSPAGVVVYSDGEVIGNLTAAADGVVKLYAVWDGGTTAWSEDEAFSAVVANAYDGYMIDEDYNLLGVVQVKTTKQSVKTTTDKKTKVKTVTTNITATATVTDANGKKWSYSKGVVTADGVVTGLKCTTKGCLVPEFGVTLGQNGMAGVWGEYAIFGARNGMGTKGDAMMAALDAYKGKWSVTIGTLRLQLDVQAKGVVKIAGNWESGAKVSASAQMVMGDGFAYVPVMVKATKTSSALNALLRIDAGGEVALLSEGELVGGGRTTAALEVVGYLAENPVKAGAAYVGRVALNELAYPAKFTQKGLPTGLKIDAATGVVSGTPTKPGEYVVTFTATSSMNSKSKDTVDVTIKVDNYVDGLIPVEDYYGPYTPGVSYTVTIPEAAGCAVSGLPTGMKWTAKDVKAKDGTVTTPANSVYGIPTKPGKYTVYFKKSVSELNAKGKSVKVTHTATATFEVSGYPMIAILPSLAIAGSEPMTVAEGAALSFFVGVKQSFAINLAGTLDGVDTTVSAKGLPTGLKLVKKTIYVDPTAKKKVVDHYEYVIEGMPTKASSVDKKTKAVVPSHVKLTASNKYKWSGTFAFDIKVVALPAWAYGTFNGGNTNGMATLTVSNVGKLSGKWMSEGLTWTLSAASYDAYYPDDAKYVATVIGKSGKLVMTNEIEVTEGGVSSPIFEAWRNGWKEEPLKTLAKDLKGKTVSMTAPRSEGAAGTVLLTVGASGAVTAKGTFVTGFDETKQKDIAYSASCSTVLIPTAEAGLYKVYLYFPPKSGKFNGFSACESVMFAP